jgi:hypothetical protein
VLGEVNEKWSPIAGKLGNALPSGGARHGEVGHPASNKRMCIGARGVVVVGAREQVTDPMNIIGIGE